MKANAKVIKTKIKTYATGAASELPYFIEKKQYQGASGKVYPLKVTETITNEAMDKEYDLVELENEYIKVNILPEIGGKIYGAKSKYNGYEFIYQNTVIKPALIGLSGPWVSGGVEFNWPQHHRPTTYLPVEYEIKHKEDGSCTCFVGEAEPFNRMRAMAAITIYPDSSVVEVKATVTNHADHALPFMWWNNTAVRVHDEYKCLFPPDISYGADHDRRAVVPFPFMKGVFATARPYDYGDGVDASWFKNVKVQTSVMIPKYESDMDFVGGYDYSRDAGTVIVGDHYIAPGKKMFTWANCEFGKKWCSNLTDNDDRYIELMTGAYTDNQPDFTYIEPGETKEFAQVWYPIQGIGNVSCANQFGAVSLSIEEKAITVGAVSSGYSKAAALVLLKNGKEIYRKINEFTPDSYILETISMETASKESADSNDTFELILLDDQNKPLVSYKPIEKDDSKAAPVSREIPLRPKEIESLEELYLQGAHLLQYKHGTYDAKDYFLEALSRSPEDYRCNLEMGKLELEKGNFIFAKKYLDAAYKRITLRNNTPRDPEVSYTLGRLECLEDNLDKAYGHFKDASWQYAYRSAANFECACIDLKMGRKEEAVKELRQALETNTKHYKAASLLGYLTNDVDYLRKLSNDFPQESFLNYALYLLTGETVSAFITSRSEDVLDVVLLYKKAGLVEEAIKIMETCTNPSCVFAYHRQTLGEEKTDVFNNPLYVLEFPKRLEDIEVLRRADWYGKYLLGCLYYDRENYEMADRMFEASIGENESFAFSHRNLAILAYDHQYDAKKAILHMSRAIEICPDHPRLIYEYMQLEKNENISLNERVEFAENHVEQVEKRDDAYLDLIIMYIQTGEYDRAKELLGKKNFHIYEGGEGKLTKYHRWLYILSALDLHKQGKDEECLKEIAKALYYPENYGEGESILRQDSNVRYFAGLFYEAAKEKENALISWKEAERDAGQVNEVLFFKGLCYEKLNRREEANALYDQLIAAGTHHIDNKDLYGYFGVGLENPLPLELNIQKRNLVWGYTYTMLGYYGKKDTESYEKAKSGLKSVDPNNAFLAIFTCIESLL